MLNSLLGRVREALAPARGRDLGELVKALRQDAQDRPMLARWLPYVAYLAEEQLFVNADSLGFCLELLPQSGADEEMVQILQSLYAALPPKGAIQFHLFCSPHIGDILRRYASLRLEDADAADKALEFGRPARNDNPFRAMARRRVGYYRHGAQHAMFRGFPYRLRNFRLVVSVTVPGHADDLSQREALLVLRDGICATFQAAGFPNRVWQAEDLLNWVAALLNPDRLLGEGLPIRWNPHDELRDQIVARDTRSLELETGLLLHKPGGDAALEARFYSIKSFPERFALWQMGGLIGDLFQGALQVPCPFMITLGVMMLDPDKAKNLAFVNAANADREARSPMAGILPHLREKDRDWKAVAQVIVNGGQLVSLYHEIALFSRPEEATQAQQAAYAIWRSRGFTLNNDCYIQRAALLASLPMSLSEPFHADLARFRMVSTKTSLNAIHLAPLIGEWRGSATPVMLFGGRRGQLVSLDLFDNRMGGKNVAIAGKTGSGKSVLLNEFASSYLGLGAQVWIIDLGRSYEKACENFGGQFIQFREDAQLCINPFSCVEHFEEDFSMLHPLLMRMASPTQALEPYQQTLLANALTAAWAKYGRDTTITKIRDLMREGRLREGDEPQRELKQLAVMLEPYTVDGVYGRFFEGEASIDFHNQLVVLELEELKRKPALQQIVLMVMIYRIAQAMYRDRAQRKLVILDEAREFLGAEGADNDMMARFIDDGFARARKYNGAFITATQGVDHYYASKAGVSAFNNADFVFLLQQKKESVEMLDRAGRLAMDEHMKRLLMSLRAEEGQFAEMYIDSSIGSGLVRLIPDPHNLLMFSNRAEDNAPLDALRAQGLSVTEAIDVLLRERGIASY